MHVSTLIIAPFYTKAITATASVTLPASPDPNTDAGLSGKTTVIIVLPTSPDRSANAGFSRKSPNRDRFRRTICPAQPTANNNQKQRASVHGGNGVGQWIGNRNSPTGGRTRQKRRALVYRANETHLQRRVFFADPVRSRATASLRQLVLVNDDAMIRTIAICNKQCACTRVVEKRLSCRQA